MKIPAPLSKVERSAQEMGFHTEVQVSNGTFSLIGHRADMRLGFQAYWSKGSNADTPGTGWAGALVVDPVGLPQELYGDYAPKAQGSKKPTAQQIENGKRMDAEYNTGHSWLNRRPFLTKQADFYAWMKDWRSIILGDDS